MIYEFAATQDLHGYDEPWAPGAGKNLYPYETIPAYSYKWYTDYTFDETSDKVLIEADTDYILSFENTANQRVNIRVFDTSENLITDNTVFVASQGIYPLSYYSALHAFSVSGNISDKYVNIKSSVDAYINIVMGQDCLASTKVQLELGSTTTSYTPYSNICPPQGYNIWDPSQDKMIQVYAGYVNANTRELYLRPVYKDYAGEELVGPWMSSLDEYSEDATPTEGAFVIDFGGELTSYEITPFMLQTLLDSLGIRQHFTDGAGLLNKLMDQAQGRVRSEEELLHLSRPLHVIAIGEDLPTNLVIKKPISDVLPGLPGKIKI